MKDGPPQLFTARNLQIRLSVCAGVHTYLKLLRKGEGLSVRSGCGYYFALPMPEWINSDSFAMPWNHIIKGYSAERVLNLLCSPGKHYPLNAL